MNYVFFYGCARQRRAYTAAFSIGRQTRFCGTSRCFDRKTLANPHISRNKLQQFRDICLVRIRPMVHAASSDKCCLLQRKHPRRCQHDSSLLPTLSLDLYPRILGEDKASSAIPTLFRPASIFHWSDTNMVGKAPRSSKLPHPCLRIGTNRASRIHGSTVFCRPESSVRDGGPSYGNQDLEKTWRYFYCRTTETKVSENEIDLLPTPSMTEFDRFSIDVQMKVATRFGSRDPAHRYAFLIRLHPTSDQ